MENNRTFKNRY